MDLSMQVLNLKNLYLKNIMWDRKNILKNNINYILNKLLLVKYKIY